MSMLDTAPSAVQVAQLVGGAINMMLPSTCVFDYPTCASLAGFISGTQVGCCQAVT